MSHIEIRIITDALLHINTMVSLRETYNTAMYTEIKLAI